MSELRKIILAPASQSHENTMVAPCEAPGILFHPAKITRSVETRDFHFSHSIQREIWLSSSMLYGTFTIAFA